MLRLSILGGAALEGTDSVQSVLAQPKRLAVLAFLALRMSRGVQRRDTLLGLFWPESDDERARNALNVALYSLRRALGPGIMVSRGREEVGLDPAELWCDAVAFEEALDAGLLEEALELYRGELLPGYFLSNAPEFERWLDGERARLAHRAFKAARMLAEGAEAVGDHPAAAEWARRMLAIVPGSEQSLRRLIVLLDRMGDRAGAVRAYDRFARQVNEDLELDPSPETRALVEAIRTRVTVREDGVGDPAAPRADPRTASPRRVGEVGIQGGAPALSRVVSVGRGRTRLVLSVATLVVILGVVGAGYGLSRGSSGSEPEAASVARAYFEGELELREGRYAAAVRAFERAIAADSGFAQAYYGLSKASNWTAESGRSVWAAEQALRRADRAPPEFRLRIEAWHAYLNGEPALAERLYRTILAHDPADVDAWFYLGETQYHWMPSLGQPAAESRMAWQQVLDREPENAGALIHLARVAAIEGHRAEFDALSARFTRLSPGIQETIGLRLLRAFAFGDRAERERTAQELVQTEGNVRRSTVLAAVAHSNDLAGAPELLVPWIIPTAENPAGRVLEYLLWAEMEIARGRIDAADEVLDTVLTFQPGLALEYRGMIAALDFLDLAPSWRLEVRRALGGPAPPDGGYGRELPWREFLGGMIDVRLGDLAAAARAAAEIERFSGNEIDAFHALGLARQLRAEMARAAGRFHEALALLEEPRLRPADLLPTVLSYPRAHERWLRAELHHALGHDAEALRLYATFPDPQGYDLMYLAPSHLRRAEIHEAAGVPEKADWHRARVIALWRNSDVELRPERLPERP